MDYTILQILGSILIIIGNIISNIDYIFDRKKIARANAQIEEKIDKDSIFGMDKVNFLQILANGFTLYFSLFLTIFIYNKIFSYEQPDLSSMEHLIIILVGGTGITYYLLRLVRSLRKGFLKSLGFVLSTLGSIIVLYSLIRYYF